ncbi:hypothetical protein GCM10009557_05990 [Virgisporangium ochraceum]|uniref:ADP ribosyltransferase domain-containing protein n=1 Tax=Virgisporangium ochraceum TaxID=65505 RepID=A0A8J3ZM38_9ACTN|nr:phage minor capsid protein [Virgisporangium ochraceum]GIJ66256.1 hypothetical protein Voc01_011730 [Virgisporangium ochraceum]
MPVDQADVDAITSVVTSIYRDGEMALGSVIAEHLRAGNETGPEWAVGRMAASSALRRASELIANRLRNRGAAAAREAMAAAYRTGGAAALEELPRERRIEARAARAARDVIPGTDVVESLAAALVRDIGERSGNVLRDVQDAYRGVITGAVARMQTQGVTRLEASQQAWQALVDRGITGFTDRAGRRWELSTYVEMAVRTTSQRAAVQGQTDRLGELGVDLVQVSNAPQECELCRPFEGKILARESGGTVGKVKVEHAIDDDRMVTVDVMTTLPIARSRGLFHPQCRHSVRAYLPGVTKPEPQPTADPEGDAARQRQRKIERDIRKAKAQAELALDPEAKKRWNARVKAKQAEMRDHLAANPGLLRQPHREQPGASNLGRGTAAPELQLPAAKKTAAKKAAPPANTAPAPATQPAKAAQPAKATPAKAAPQPAPAPEPEAPPAPTGVEAGDFSQLRRVGPQGGSNPGGIYEAPDGTRYYVKAQRSEAHARNEAVTAALYREAGIDVPEVRLGRGTPDLPDGHHTATRLLDDASPLNDGNLADRTAELRRGFGLDAWLGNWDVVGLDLDNVVISGGRAHRIDVGGSLRFRAQGEPKGAAFGNTVEEFHSLRDPSRAPQAARVFGGMDRSELVAALERVERIDPDTISRIVAEHGLDDDLADTLIARQIDLLDRLGRLRQQATREQAWQRRQAASLTDQAALDSVRFRREHAQLRPTPPGWNPGRVVRATDALNDYQGGVHTLINGHLRTNLPDATAERLTAALDDVMAASRLAQDVTAHRGVRDARSVFGAAWNDLDVTGLEWREQAFVSTSADVRVADEFAIGVAPLIMRMVLPRGTGAVRLSDMAPQDRRPLALDEEAEILIERGRRMRVIADHGVDAMGVRRIDVEVIEE